MSNEKTAVFWNKTIVGYILDMKVDMFHWYGKWLPESNQVTEEFMEELESGDELQVEIGSISNPIVGYVSIESFYVDQIDILVR